MLVSPPRDRPSASRFFSFDGAPEAHRGAQLRWGQPRRVHVGGRLMACPGRVLMGPHHRGIGRDRPARPITLIAPSPQRVQDHLPGPVGRPAAMPVIDRLPVPGPLRQIPPRAPHPGTGKDAVHHQPVIISPVPLPRMSGQQRRQPRPFRIGQVMPLQPVLIHGPIQPETGNQDLWDYALTGRRLNRSKRGDRAKSISSPWYQAAWGDIATMRSASRAAEIRSSRGMVGMTPPASRREAGSPRHRRAGSHARRLPAGGPRPATARRRLPPAAARGRAHPVRRARYRASADSVAGGCAGQHRRLGSAPVTFLHHAETGRRPRVRLRRAGTRAA